MHDGDSNNGVDEGSVGYQCSHFIFVYTTTSTKNISNGKKATP
jgi:hypothetical protein